MYIHNAELCSADEFPKERTKTIMMIKSNKENDVYTNFVKSSVYNQIYKKIYDLAPNLNSEDVKNIFYGDIGYEKNLSCAVKRILWSYQPLRVVKN